MKKHIKRAVILMALLGASPCALAASFNCQKAASAVEKMICKDASLSKLDDQLQLAYKTALAATDDYGRKALTKEQRNWVKYTRGICLDTACLQQVYTTRIGVLARNEFAIVDGDPDHCIKPDPPGKYIGDNCLNIVVYRDPNDRIESFNQSLLFYKNSGRIIGCRQLVDEPVGTASGNHSFGAICTLQNGSSRESVKICNADMTVKFKLLPVTSTITDIDDLARFTDAYCFGGP